MSIFPNGPYLYYLPELSNPRVAEIDSGVVWFSGDDQCVRLDKCSGRFVRLVEQHEPTTVAAAQQPGGAGNSDQNVL